MVNFINFHKFKLIFVKIVKKLQKLNLFYKTHYYVCFIKKIKTNTFLTITNRCGEVVISASTGYNH